MTKTNLEIEEEFIKELAEICCDYKVWWCEEDGTKWNIGNNIDFTDDVKKLFQALLQQRMDEIDSKIEELAELEHKQWYDWSMSLAQDEPLSEVRLKRWEKLWKPYAELTEEEKEQDRIWARKVLNIINVSR